MACYSALHTPTEGGDPIYHLHVVRKRVTITHSRRSWHVPAAHHRK